MIKNARLDSRRVGPLYFRKLGDVCLLTNDWGEHAFLAPGEFKTFLAGRLPEGALWRELQSRGFVRDRMDFGAMAERFRSLHLSDPGDAEVHTVEVTRRCNLTCPYCSASARGEHDPGQDMDEATARRVAAFILSSPAKELQIEFQGGEPLLNWPAVRLILEGIEEGVRDSGRGRRARFSLISNFSLMDAEKMDYLARRGVNLCTSLDGPADVHDANRKLLGGSSHETVAYWLSVIQRMQDAGLYPGMSAPNAVATVTRVSLTEPERIVDEFWRLGLTRVQLGPIEPFGRARQAWGRLGITAEEYLVFYRRAMDRLLQLCRHHPVVYEKGARIFLAAIFGKKGASSRWAEGVSELAYDIRGNVYPSDEGRLLAGGGDETFNLGNVREGRRAEVSGRRLVQAMLLWNLRAAQPACSRCAYSPFCQSVRLSAPHHAAEQGRPWGHLPSSRRCAIFRGVFDLLFEKLREPQAEAILRRWVEAAS